METKYIIMRRVYYSFALSILTGSALWQGFLLGASIAAFGRLTHVAAISNNLLATPAGSVPAYIYDTMARALVSGEIMTVLVVSLICTLSIMWAKRIGETILQFKTI